MDTTDLLKQLDGTADLKEQQKLLETLSQGLGINQYWRTTEKAQEAGRESNTKYGAHLLSHAVTSVAEGIEQFLAKAKQGGGGRRHLAARYLGKVDANVAAFLSLKCAIDSISSKKSLQKVAIEIGTYIEDETRYALFKKEEATRYRYAHDQAKKATTYTHKRNLMMNKMMKAGIEIPAWPKSDKLQTGIKVIDIIIQTTGLIEVIDVPVHKMKQHHKFIKKLAATEEATKWIADKHSRCELMMPNYLPCVIPPKNWTTPFNGGYHTNEVRPLTLVKTGNRNYLEEISNMDMPVVYRTINALQQTPWRINQPVLDVMKHVWDSSIEVPCLVSREDVREVMCSECGTYVPLSQRNNRDTKTKHECFLENDVALRKWKIEAAKAHESNAKMISKRIQTNKVIWIADIMKQYNEIYMPYQLDFRGRIYAVPFYLNPQGADYAKGLLTFSEAKPLGTDEAVWWLAIHGANVYGEDKISLTDRIKFICDMSQEIKAIAEDPLAHLDLWTEADKPWQFLAFCYEWAGFLREGKAFKSCLPIALDGSCSGIQHFSAMLRDEEGGRAVNLLPSEVPSDIYQIVCDKVIEKLKVDVEDPEAHPYAGTWLSLKPDRKLTKRQVMTLPYGSTQYSCREYTAEYLSDLEESLKFKDPGFVMPWQESRERMLAVTYMSNMIWEAIEETVIGARGCMDWLKVWARKVAKENLPITWTTPVGLPVYQFYANLKKIRIKSTLGGSVVFTTLQEYTKDINKKRMEQGIAPNFVHSMDASHLMLSVDKALRTGIGSFAMIHDSFGTHASETEKFSKILRSAFVEMYETNDVLEQFKSDMLEIIPDDKKKSLPKNLEIGSLSLSDLHSSDFFFA